jgi:hypothetical protein
MMRRIKFMLVSVVVLLISTPFAHSQFLGQLETAPTLLRGNYSFGGYAGVYDDAFAISGGFRSGIADYMDFGLRLGMLNYEYDNRDDESGILVGVDLKYRILETEIGDPLDLSMGGGMEISSVENFTRLGLGGNLILSRDFCFENGRSISPYGRLNLRMERKSWTHSWGEEGRHDTDFEMGINLGLSLELTARTFLVGEIQLDEFDGIIVGANFYID